ncbi:disease resistance response protein [Panicum miliaceum]|uniref:Dirigent protein n=1 Tax=Panicum miliaceum TaxID=4540 RepID=A0A3L6S186_PANMI|nr:disease resistance response protein [Panicum miliaceum]
MASSVANTTSSKRRRLLLLAAAVALTILVPPVSARRLPVQLVVYVHEILDGPGQTEKLLIRGPGPENPTLWPPNNLFGDTVVMDDLVTEDLAIDSAPVGRVYGTYMTGSMTLPVHTVSFTLRLSAGPYNGSTLVMAGIDDETIAREHAVVGGTEALRGAQGYVLGEVIPVSPPHYVVMKLTVNASVPVPTTKAKAAASHLIIDM